MSKSVLPLGVTELHEQAVVKFQRGEFQGAVDDLRVVVSKSTSNPSALAHLAAALNASGNAHEALEISSSCLALAPNEPEYHFNDGVFADACGKSDRAIASYVRALELRPSYSTAWFNLGCIHHRLENKQVAIDCYRKAVEHDAKYLKAILSLGTVLQKEKRPQEAREVLEKAVEYFPNHSKVLRRLGLVLFDLGDLQGASDRLRKAKELDPQDADNWHSLAGVELIKGEVGEARVLFDGALRLKPQHEEAQMGKAILDLAEGNYREGWPGYELRLRRNQINKQLSEYPRWDGSPLNGRTLLVHAEQGIGDTIQFVRYLDRLRSENGRVITLAPEILIPLLRQSGVEDVFNGTHQAPPFDLQVPLMSLGGVYGDTPETLPRPIPYLRAREDLMEKWRSFLDGYSGLRIGIHWQGNPSFNRDRFRSFPLEAFSELAMQPNLHLFSLQKNHGIEQVAGFSQKHRLVDLGERLDGEAGAFQDTAALVATLDLVITSDSAVAHLAGAMGAQVWLATAFSPDWRWMLKGSSSPWYPTMRLFRQSRINDWKSVFSEMTNALADFRPKPVPPFPLLRERSSKVGITTERTLVSSQEKAVKFQEATQLHQSGKKSEAEEIYTSLAQVDPSMGEVQHALGVLRFEQGKYAEATAYLQRAIELEPTNALYHRNIGPAIQLSSGKSDEAIRYMCRSIELNPLDGEAHFNLAGLYSTTGEYEKAAASYRETIRLNPQHVQAWVNLGQVQQKLGQIAEAIQAYQRALLVKEGDLSAGKTLAKLLSTEGRHMEAVRVWRRLALTHKKNLVVASGLGESLDAWYRSPHFEKGRRAGDEGQEVTSETLMAERDDILVQAILAYREAIRIAPENAIVWGKLGAALSNAGRTAEALKCFENALRIKPKFSQVALAYVQALNNEHKFKEAIEHCERSLRELPKDFALWRALAAAKRGIADIKGAEEAIRRCLELVPNDWESRAELMYIASHQGQWLEAMEIGKKLLEERPNDLRAELELSLQKLRYGDMPQGWRDYECRRRLSKWRKCVPGGDVSTHTDWDGKPLGGKTLLVYHEQGIGDTIQFIRYYSRLKSLDGEVVLQVHPPLVDILRQSGYSNVLSKDAPLPAFDCAIPLMSLPNIYQDTMESLPRDVPYIHPRPQLIDYWRKYLEQYPGFRIGIHWQGSPHFKADCYRSFPLKCYEGISKLPRVRLLSLQKNFGVEQIAQLEGAFEVINLGYMLDEKNGAFQDTAALARSLDLIITSDSAVAHMAGAVGANVWVIVPSGCDWRWCAERTDSPWYPTMKIYRQDKVGDWKSVFRRVSSDLQDLLKSSIELND